MSKKIIASLALGMVLAASAAGSIIGCGGNGNNGGSGGTGGGGSGGGGGGMGNADMSFVCVPNPMTNDDFLNSCAPAGVDSVNIDPFYPTLAPGGQLPTLP
jgi:hypothetical protein